MSTANFNRILYCVIDFCGNCIDILNDITIGPLTLLGWLIGFFGFSVVISMLYALFNYHGIPSIRN